MITLKNGRITIGGKLVAEGNFKLIRRENVVFIRRFTRREKFMGFLKNLFRKPAKYVPGPMRQVVTFETSRLRPGFQRENLSVDFVSAKAVVKSGKVMYETFWH